MSKRDRSYDFKLAENNLFYKACKDFLPSCIKVGGVNYKLHYTGLLAGGYRISYGEFDGDFFNWNNKLLDLSYKLCTVIPEPTVYTEGQLRDATIYKLTISEIIDDCEEKLKAFNYELLDEIVTPEVSFSRELTSLLNKYSKENASNTPDFILANYITSCLHTFNIAIKAREKWYGENNEIINSNDEQ